MSDADLKRAMTEAASVAPLPRTSEVIQRPKEDASNWADNTLHGILDDFKGELSQLDPGSGSSLDLRDPSTPARRAAFWTKTNGVILSPHTLEDHQDGRLALNKVESTPTHPTTPTLTLHLPPQTEQPIVPPRSSSLQMPPRSPSGPNFSGSARVPNSKHGTSPLRSRSGPSAGMPPHSPRDSARLRVLHRSTASNSEPSLIPNGDDMRGCKGIYIPFNLLSNKWHNSFSTYKLAARPHRHRLDAHSLPVSQPFGGRWRRSKRYGDTRQGIGFTMLA